MAAAPDDFALVIGIQHYPDYRPLEGSAADAKAFAHWLTDDPLGAGLPAKQCKLITSRKRRPPVPIKTQIDDAVGEIKRASAHGARRLYFYFSGHGMSTNDLDLALCMASWSDDRPLAALSYTCYFNFFRKIGNFQEVVFLLDCCRVRDLSAVGLCPEHDAARPSNQTGQVSTFTAFASEFGDAAYEAQLAEEEARIPPTFARGHFTEALLEALQGGAAGTGAGVTALSLEAHLKKRVAEIAARHRHKQKARVETSLAAGVEMVFGQYTAVHNVVIDFAPPRNTTVVLYGPHAEEIRTAKADTGPWSLPLPAGQYSLKEGNTERFFRVRGGTEIQHERF